MFAYGYAGSYHAISAYPYIIINSDLFGGNLLMAWRHAYVLVAVVKAGYYNVLCCHAEIANFNRANYYCTDADARAFANKNIAHAVIDHSKVFYDTFGTERKFIKGEKIHPGITPYHAAFTTLMKKTVKYQPNP
jgi:hypothetical protein